MTSAFDDTCARCKASTADEPHRRVVCARCAAHSHASCRGESHGCASCGEASTLAERDARGAGGKGVWIGLLLALTCALGLVKVLGVGRFPFGDHLEVHALPLGLFVAAALVVVRLVPR